jgi:hypothetical protein
LKHGAAEARRKVGGRSPLFFVPFLVCVLIVGSACRWLEFDCDRSACANLRSLGASFLANVMLALASW